MPGRADRKTWLCNIGANSSHPYFSPIFPDGTFELLPIPESPPDAGPASVRLGDVPLQRPGGGTAAGWVPQRLHGVAAHLDPEFDTLTYGDNCERAARAVALRKVAVGDLILFIARLRPHGGSRRAGWAGFYLVGLIEVESILPAVFRRPDDRQLDRFRANAHVRKGLNDPAHWDGFWVFGGSARSARFQHAVPVDRSLCDAVMRTAAGQPWQWPDAGERGRTDLQVIGSYSRTCRAILSPDQPGNVRRSAALFAAIESRNRGAVPG